MRVFVAEERDPRWLRAFLNPEDCDDNLDDPFTPRSCGWRIVIERPDVPGDAGIVRSTREQHLDEALQHMELYWPGPPIWRDFATGQIVTLVRDGACGFDSGSAP